MDAEFWARVERARQMTPAERVREGFRLREVWLEQLLREVKPGYTDEARRRGTEGDVVLEIVVRSDGNVGDVKLLRSLGSGLDQKAIEAVRQWKFSPARRMGAPVDVVVEVSVNFKQR